MVDLLLETTEQVALLLAQPQQLAAAEAAVIPQRVALAVQAAVAVVNLAPLVAREHQAKVLLEALAQV